MAERTGPGRPPRDPYDVIDYRTTVTETGVSRTPIRVIDRIEETLKANAFIHDAAARAGISVETLRMWRAKGNRGSIDLLAGRKKRSDLDVITRRCIELASRMEKAEAESRTMLLAKTTQLAQGGLEQTRVVERVDGNGNLIDRSEERRKLLPDARALTWLLSHRYPADFAGRVEVTGPQGGPIEVEVSARDRILDLVHGVRERTAEPLGNGQRALGNGANDP